MSDSEDSENSQQISDDSDKNEVDTIKSTPSIQSKNNDTTTVSWKDLGLVDTLCEKCIELKWKFPSKIQREAIPVAIQGNDIIGLAETGSGKTAAFALPILQALLDHPQRFFALILAPTRELAIQISEQFDALGNSLGVKCCVLVGGIDMTSQAILLAKKPHIIVATPGRLIDHLENTKQFNLKRIRFLVMDEADRILNMDFEMELNKVLKVIPAETRQTFLFSATMTKKVKKLLRASLRNPVKVEVISQFQTVEKLKQYYLFVACIYKDEYLVHVLNELAGNSIMIFCNSCNTTIRIGLMLRALGITAVPLHGQMSQKKRLAALEKFKIGSKSILIATDVASRGLDIPSVDVVLNFDTPTRSKDYIHRVGRTARAGRAGKAITFVTQYEIELYQRIEHFLGFKLPEFVRFEEEVAIALKEKVGEAQRTAKVELKDIEMRKKMKNKRRRGGGGDGDGSDEENDNDAGAAPSKRFKGANEGGSGGGSFGSGRGRGRGRGRGGGRGRFRGGRG